MAQWILRWSFMLLLVSFFVQIVLASFISHDEEQGVLTYEILEELPVHSMVADIFKDSNLNKGNVLATPKSLQFEILFGTFQDFFTIELTTGLLHIKQIIDRDIICFKKSMCSLQLDIEVSGSDQFIKLFQLVFIILDINDNAPAFHPSKFVLNISESLPLGSKIALPSAAEDFDTGENGRLHYDYSRNTSKIELLVLGNGDGADINLYLMLAEKLDREEESVYALEIVASDGGNSSRLGYLEIIIFIEDANDNVPKFEKDLYNVSIVEDFTLISPFLQVHAVDPDEGPNGQVVYGLARSSMLAHGNLFHVHSATGDLYLKQNLDYQKEQEYILTVGATDKGLSPIPAYTRIIITVIDVNDNAPTIKVKSHLEIPEGQSEGTFVGHASVDDTDSGLNGLVQCEILQVEFLLDKLYPKVYRILANKIFDREKQEMYVLTIACHDNGSPQRETTQDIYVRITDINDNDPVFTQDLYSVNVKENNSLNVPIMHIKAHDDDAGENSAIEYSLTNNSLGLLTIDAQTGIISTAFVFDYEEKTGYEFIAVATDKGRPEPRSTTATITVNVIDFNDEAPAFIQTLYNFGTYENQLPGTEIGTVSAIDRDTPPYDRFAFSIMQSKPFANIFQIDANTGKITTLKMLDREQYPIHYLTIAATNIAFPNPSSFVNVTVHVADRNDNAPLIDYPSTENCTLELAADTPIGGFVARIQARDADIGQNARLEYAIAQGNDGDMFHIDQLDGTLTLKRLLPAFRAVTRYSLILVVQDCGEPEKSASSILGIFINTSVVSDWKSVAGPSSRMFDAYVKTLFSYEVIISLSCVMAALIIVLSLTIIYIRRRSRLVADRVAPCLNKSTPRLEDFLKYSVTKTETFNEEYTYCPADSFDAKDEVTNTLKLSKEDYRYEQAEDTERPRTHYTFAKVDNQIAASCLGSGQVHRPLLFNSSFISKSASSVTSQPKIANREDKEFHRLLEVLRKVDSDGFDCSSNGSVHSDLNIGHSLGETDVEHAQNSGTAQLDSQKLEQK